MLEDDELQGMIFIHLSDKSEFVAEHVKRGENIDKKRRGEEIKMADLTNLFAEIPAELPEELVQTLLSTPGVRIERIVSLGHASPEDFWYDQKTHEWVLVLTGSARLRIEGKEPIDLLPGAFVNIPARQRHRVEWTDPAQPTIWLALHYGGDPT